MNTFQTQNTKNHPKDQVLEQVYTALYRYGDTSLAGQLTQNGLEYYVLGSGFITFRTHSGRVYVLGDPIGPLNERGQLLTTLLECFPEVCFVQISRSTASILAAEGYLINCFGVERKLPLPYSREGKTKGWVRNLYNAGRQNHLYVRELPQAFINQPRHYHIRPGSHKNSVRFKKDFSFLARSGSELLPAYSRIFGGFQNGALMGYSIFDPMYQNGEIIGYSEVVPKRSPLAPKGTRVYILLKAIEQFYREERVIVSLGLSPLDKIEKYDALSGFRSSGITRLLLLGLRRYGRTIFNFSGLSFHKSRFVGDEYPVFLASRNAVPLKELLGIYQLTTNYRFPPGIGVI